MIFCRLRHTRLTLAACILGLYATTGPVHGADTRLTAELPPYEVQHKITGQLGYGPGDSVLGSPSHGFGQFRYQPAFTWYLPQRTWPDWQLYSRLWLTYNNEDASNPYFEGSSPEGSSIELRDFYARRERLFDDPRLSMTIGRQPYRAPLGLWWDTSLESIRMQWQDTFHEGFLALGQRLHSYNSAEGHLDANEQDIVYLMAEYGLRWSPQGWTGVRLQAEYDYSGSQPQGDPEDINAVRGGIFLGERERADDALLTDYHIEAIWLQGQRESSATNASPDTDTLQGWAVVAAFGHHFRFQPWKPRLAFRGGITDASGHDDNGFYLNDLQSDRIHLHDLDRRAIGGSFVRLTMSNTLFYGVRLELQPATRQLLTLMAMDIQCRSDDGALPIERVDGRCDGRNAGQVLDMNYRWDMFPVGVSGSQLNWQLIASLGHFNAGSALPAGSSDTQVLLSTELSW